MNSIQYNLKSYTVPTGLAEGIFDPSLPPSQEEGKELTSSTGSQIIYASIHVFPKHAEHRLTINFYGKIRIVSFEVLSTKITI